MRFFGVGREEADFVACAFEDGFEDEFSVPACRNQIDTHSDTPQE